MRQAAQRDREAAETRHAADALKLQEHDQRFASSVEKVRSLEQQLFERDRPFQDRDEDLSAMLERDLASKPRRRASRYNFSGKVTIDFGGESGVLVDLSIAGAQVLSARALEQGREAQLTLLSDEIPIKAKAKYHVVAPRPQLPRTTAALPGGVVVYVRGRGRHGSLHHSIFDLVSDPGITTEDTDATLLGVIFARVRRMKSPASAIVCVAAIYLGVAVLVASAQQAPTTPAAKPPVSSASARLQPTASQPASVAQENNATIRRYCAGCHSDAAQERRPVARVFDIAQAARERGRRREDDPQAAGRHDAAAAARRVPSRARYAALIATLETTVDAARRGEARIPAAARSSG